MQSCFTETVFLTRGVLVIVIHKVTEISSAAGFTSNFVFSLIALEQAHLRYTLLSVLVLIPVTACAKGGSEKCSEKPQNCSE